MLLALAASVVFGAFLVIFIVSVVPCLSINCRRRTMCVMKRLHRTFPLICGLDPERVTLAQAIRKYETGLASPQVRVWFYCNIDLTF